MSSTIRPLQLSDNSKIEHDPADPPILLRIKNHARTAVVFKTAPSIVLTVIDVFPTVLRSKSRLKRCSSSQYVSTQYISTNIVYPVLNASK